MNHICASGHLHNTKDGMVSCNLRLGDKKLIKKYGRNLERYIYSKPIILETFVDNSGPIPVIRFKTKE